MMTVRSSGVPVRCLLVESCLLALAIPRQSLLCAFLPVNRVATSPSYRIGLGSNILGPYDKFSYAIRGSTRTSAVFTALGGIQVKIQSILLVLRRDNSLKPKIVL